MGDLSTYAPPSVSRAVASTRALSPCMNLGSVVRALRGNSSSTLLALRNGSDWFFALDRFLAIPRPFGRSDVMNQVVPFEVTRERQGSAYIEARNSRVAFEHVWDGEYLASMALLEAMRTNKTVRCLDLFLNFGILEERLLTAIEDSLLENDTLQIFAICVGRNIVCPLHTVRATFSRILERNMCLRQLHVHCLTPDDPFRDDPFRVRLGATVTGAMERNEQAFVVAKALGQVSRSSMHGCPHLGDIGFRRQLLLFFLQKGCQAPPMMLYIAEGLPKH